MASSASNYSLSFYNFLLGRKLRLIDPNLSQIHHGYLSEYRATWKWWKIEYLSMHWERSRSFALKSNPWAFEFCHNSRKKRENDGGRFGDWTNSTYFDGPRNHDLISINGMKFFLKMILRKWRHYISRLFIRYWYTLLCITQNINLSTQYKTHNL